MGERVVLLVSLLWLLPGNCAQAQMLLHGNVLDQKGVPIVGASVTLKAAPDQAILVFALTDGQGAYQLPRTGPTDSLWLMASHLNFVETGRWVGPTDSLIHLTLTDRTHDLPELVVKQAPVVRRGDTLVFDVNQLHEAEDRTVEQLLARIPGIEIEDDGTILYDGLEISRFYIEGLDLLEGRYALATRHLRPDAIRDVEILERHQPIRALDSLERPPNAAINLRLKSGLSLTGAARLGTGAAPSLYLAEASLFGFAKQQQFALLGSTNNVGNALGDNFSDLYQTGPGAVPLMSARQPTIPARAAPRDYLDNREATAGFNFLRRLGQSSQLKWGGLVSHDRRLNRGGSQILYRGADTSRAEIIESLAAEERPRRYQTQFRYEHNAPALYLRGSLEGSHVQHRILAANVFNGLPNPEEFKRHSTNLRGRLSGILRRNDRAHRLEARMAYTEERYRLAVVDLPLLVPEFPSRLLDSARQTAYRRQLTGDVYTNFYWQSKKLNGQIRTGLRGEITRLTSALTKRSGEPLEPDFTNNNDQLFGIPYLETRLEREVGPYRWTLELPLSLHAFRLHDRLRATTTTAMLPVLQPKMDLTLRLPQQHSLSWSYAYELGYDRVGELFTGYVLRQNRVFDRRLPILNRQRQHELSTRYQGHRATGLIYHNTYLSGTLTSAKLQTSTVFDVDGEASALLNRRNRRWNATLRHDQTWKLSARARLEQKLTYLFTHLRLFLNDRETGVALQQIRLAPKLIYTFSGSVLTLAPSIGHLRSTFTPDPAWTFDVSLRYYRELPGQWGTLRLSLSRVGTKISGRTVANSLARITHTLPVFGGKYELETHLANLTGAARFVSFHQQAYSDQLTTWHLRPRQIIFTLSRKI